MTVVADACPLIFLAKIHCLDLLERLFGSGICLTESVRREIVAGPITPAEAEAIARFLNAAVVERVATVRRHAAALSRADHETLALALQRKADLLLTDDRLLRELAVFEGVRPMGTLGVLLLAVRKGLLAKRVVKGHVEALVRRHGFRISIEVYEAVARELT